MTIKEYQQKASSTLQSYSSKDQDLFSLGYLALAGEVGSVLATLKKLITDGESYDSFQDKLKDELGDTLWYISAIASHNKLDLEEIAKDNLAKTQDRFIDETPTERFDLKYPERFPDSFIINFIEEVGTNDLLEVKMTWEKENGETLSLGDPLTDNSKQPNDYRYHDVFHLGNIAFLGWSPVIRSLMNLKRRSDPNTLDSEDRGRPQVAEEAITLIIYNYAKRNKMLKLSNRIETELLHTVKQIVTDLEVASVSLYNWEKTILESYKVFHSVVQNKGGKVLVSPSEKKLEYLGK